MILNRDLQNISHMFENCAKLIEFSIPDKEINLEDENDFEVYYNYNNYTNYNIDNNTERLDNFYKNLKNDDDIYTKLTKGFLSLIQILLKKTL